MYESPKTISVTIFWFWLRKHVFCKCENLAALIQGIWLVLAFTRGHWVLLYRAQRKKVWEGSNWLSIIKKWTLIVPGRMIVIVYLSTQVWKSARVHHLLLLLLTRTSTQLSCTVEHTHTRAHARTLSGFKLNPIRTVCVSASDLCITLSEILHFSNTISHGSFTRFSKHECFPFQVVYASVGFYWLVLLYIINSHNLNPSGLLRCKDMSNVKCISERSNSPHSSLLIQLNTSESVKGGYTKSQKFGLFMFLKEAHQGAWQ